MYTDNSHLGLLSFHYSKITKKDSVDAPIEEMDVAEEAVTSEQKDEDMLILDHLPIELEARVGKIRRIYIRQSYIDLYDMVTATMLNNLHTAPGILFTGVPGIGKSLFLIYLLCRYLLDDRFPDKRFAFQSERDKYTFFRPAPCSQSQYGYTFVCRCSRTDLFTDLYDILLLVDMSAQEEPPVRARWTLMFSSPNPRRHKEFLKVVPAFDYTLPTWSKFELSQVNSDIGSWFKRFVLCGGVARYVLWNGQGIDPLKRHLNTALHDKGATVAEYFFKNGFGDIDDNKSYQLVHINPPRGVDGRWEYDGSPVFTFASDFVFQQIKSKFTRGLVTEAVGWYNAGGSLMSEKIGAVSAGHLFEKICLWLVPISSTEVSVVKLPLEQSVAPVAVKFPGMKTLDWNWENVKTHEVGVFYQPQISNLESGDAFCAVMIDNQLTLIVVQITVGESHPIKANGLKKIVQCYDVDFERKIVLFCIPKQGKLHKRQPFHTQQDKVIDPKHIPEAVKGFEQWRCEIEIDVEGIKE